MKAKKKSAPKRVRVVPSGRCFYCLDGTGPENYCYGCNAYICFGCDAPHELDGLISGAHKKELHLMRIMQLPFPRLED